MHNAFIQYANIVHICVICRYVHGMHGGIVENGQLHSCVCASAIPATQPLYPLSVSLLFINDVGRSQLGSVNRDSSRHCNLISFPGAIIGF